MRRLRQFRQVSAALLAVIVMAVSAVVLVGCGEDNKGNPGSGDNAVGEGGIPTPTKTTFVDGRDGKVYKKVTIGSQVWMAENLNFDDWYDDIGRRIGDCYGGKEDSCAKYGMLYRWEDAVRSCPSGWHLPSVDEFMTLVYYVRADYHAYRLRTTEGWRGSIGTELIRGTDEYGFSALPGGTRGVNSGYDLGSGVWGNWWSSTGDVGNSENAYNLRLSSGTSYVTGLGSGYGDSKWDRMSVRCIKN